MRKRHRVFGRGTKRIAGKTAKMNRSAPSTSGGVVETPTLMTTKLMPQIKATRMARRMWGRGISKLYNAFLRGARFFASEFERKNPFRQPYGAGGRSPRCPPLPSRREAREVR